MHGSLPSFIHAAKDKNGGLHAVSAYHAGMDLVAACRVFIHVGERGSFTLGAAAARVPQSVASRRIAALEEHFAERLFDRSTRRAALTPFGRDMLPSAKRLVQLAEAMEYHAEQAKLRPLRLAMPETCSLLSLARLSAAAHEQGIVLHLCPAGPAERAELVAAAQVRAALLAVDRHRPGGRVPGRLTGEAAAGHRRGRPDSRRAAGRVLDDRGDARGDGVRRTGRAQPVPSSRAHSRG